MNRARGLHAALCAISVTLLAFAVDLRADVVYEENFNGFAAQANPPRWIDTTVGKISGRRRLVNAGLPIYRTWLDPLDAANVVFGTKEAAGNAGETEARFGVFSTLETPSFARNLEYSGRFLRGGSDTRIGVTFFSSYPEKDRYGLIGLAPASEGRLTMQLFSFGTGTFSGSTDSRFTPEPNVWYRFRVLIDSEGIETSVRAHFWRDGDAEPSIDSIAATQRDAERLAAGRIGIWSAVSGGAYFDDLTVSSGSPPVSGQPAIAITSPSPNQILGSAVVIVSGTVANATAVTVNGLDASVDQTRGTFTSPEIPLLEGSNAIVAVARDSAGQTASASLPVVVDTRAPELTALAPLTGSCIDASTIEVRGRAIDPALKSVRIAAGTSAFDATIATDSTWSASIPAPGEGEYALRIEASDTLGHTSALVVAITIDRTAPRVDVSESGAPMDGIVTNRALAPIVRALDADARISMTTTLDGAPYTTGSVISAEGDHQMKVVATDCAGHVSEKSVNFTIDRTAPQIITISPATGSTVGARPGIAGTVSPDTAGVIIEPLAVTAAIANGAFSVADVPLIEGANDLTIALTDRAGNASQTAYRITLHSLAPHIEILDNGSPIPAGALFNRAVSPSIRSTDPEAKIVATLNGAEFRPGTTISADGDYTLIATATDSAAHTVQTTVTFTIDTTPPVVKITSPTEGASIAGTTAEIRGTVSTDAIFASVNGAAALINAGAFAATVALDAGPNDIEVVARDRAGNLAADRVSVTRSGGPRGIILTSPPDGMVTNRNTIAVTGQLLTGTADAKVTIAGTDVAVDAAGSFRKNDVALVEGDNLIVAAVLTAAGETNQVSVHVIADRTPPRVRLLESGQPLSDGARFADRAVISVEATNGTAALTPQLTIDGTSAGLPVTITATGGHTIVASARDPAGNVTRVERAIFVGANGAGGCTLEGFDPPSGSIVTSASVTIAGRSGGAAGVKINGIAAFVANGSFCGTVELPAEGENSVTIVCTDASGNPTGAPATVVLRRVTGEPSLTITAPEEGSAVATDTITVSGTVSAGVTTVDVNGAPATVTGNSFTAAGVRLAGGLNVIAARGHNAAGRIAAVSRRVLYLKEDPSLTITSPAVGVTTGASSIDISGGWNHVDPATITISGATVQTTTFSDTSGTFVARNVPLTGGQQTITVTARDATGRIATATADVTVNPGAPSISIADPADNTVAGANAAATFTVSGTFAAAAGATVDVGGVPATISGSSFTAIVPFSTIPSGVTPVVARVTEPAGAVAIDTVRVQKLTTAPRVLDTFPPPAAVEVDSGALPLGLFSAPMDRSSLTSAFRLETTAGSLVTGTLRVDRDVLTFAPAALLSSGGTYTLRVTTAARDIAGNALQAEFTSTFTVAASAPGTPPVVVPIDAALCAQQKEIRGTATPGARVRLDYGPLSLNATASSSGSFTFQVPLSGQSGCQIARVRVVGSDGSLSPATEVRFQIDCNGPQVTSAAFDRTANRLTITFSKVMNASTVIVGQGGSVLLQLTDGRFVGGTASVQGNIATITPAEDFAEQGFTLSVTTNVADTSGAKLAFAYTQNFAFDADRPPASNHGLGFMSGEVFDGDTGRPLAGANISIEIPAAQTITSTSDARGRYAAQLPEGAHTIRISASGYVTVWRQIIVAAGSGVIPIDVRLARVGNTATAGSGDLVITHAALAPAELRIPAGGIASGASVSLTSLSAQSLPGLLPLGWSPLAVAAIDTAGLPVSAAQLTLNVSASEITAAAQSIAAVRYREDRDEWQVFIPVMNVASDGKAALPISAAGTYALVYADRAPGLVRPPLPVSGGTLQGVVDSCASGTCPPLTAKSFTIDPPVVLPTGRSVVTLKIDGSGPAIFPSGTAVQAYIDEELQLADGSRISDPPFTTDLMLYRTLAGDTGVAQLQLAPSAKAVEVVLNVGFDHIRILPYPGRLDRGTLIGPEGGRVPGDGRISIDIPTGAAPEALRSTSTTITDFAPFGSIAGFNIAGGFTLTLQRASAQSSATQARVELLMPAHVVFSGITSTAQQVVVEVLDGTPYGRVYRMAAQTIATGDGRLSTRTIDRSLLPIDGVTHEGRYLLLEATAPIAFATGTVRIPGAAFVSDSRVIAPPLGVADSTRPGGIYNVPVLANPAAPFTLIPRTLATGDGATYTHATAPDPDAVVRADLTLTLQPPALISTIPAADATDVSLTTVVRATFSPAIDSQSITSDSLAVHDTDTGAPVFGRVTAEGMSTIVWTLPPGERLLPNRRYTVSIAPTIRGTNGAPFARTYAFSFSTQKQLVSGDVHREKIRITVPDANGHSRIIGDPGALPAGWQAVAIRRGRDFTSRPQATAASDGSFVIDLPGTIALSDRIDLQIINSAGSVAAIFALTPFVTEDGKSFIASPDQDVRFTTPDGKASVSVPAGAFDEPTPVTVTPADQSAFAAVPNIDKELGFAGAVTIDFPGVAKKRLEIEIAAPAGASPQTAYYLGRLGISVLGPRVEIVDTLRLENGRLTTTLGPGAANAAIAHAFRPGTNQTFGDPQDAKNAMIAAIRGGTYEATTFLQPTTWLYIASASAGFDLFSTGNESIYLSGLSLVEKQGRTLFPVASGRPFQLVGYDSSTGLEMFRIDHQAADALDPLNAIPTAIVSPADMGPYPIFATPSRLEVVTVPPDGVTLQSVRGLTITNRAGTVEITDGVPPLPAGTRADILDVTSAASQSVTLPGRTRVAAAPGDRLLIAISDDSIDPDQTIALVFSSSIDLGGATGDQVDAVLQANGWIQIFSGNTASSLSPVTRQAVFTADNAGRRIFVRLPLQRGKTYRVIIKGDVTGTPIGTSPGLKLGQRNVGGVLVPANPSDMLLQFTTRNPGGQIATTTLPPDRGGIRDFALIGNVALIATTVGGLQAFDVSDPASLSGTSPLGRAPGLAEYWSVSADRHGRIFATGVTSTFGVVQTYRLEDFTEPPSGAPSSTIVPTAGANVSWRLGVNIGVPLGTDLLFTDRPEAIPRKVQVLLQDTENPFPVPAGATPVGSNGFMQFDANVLVPGTLKYWKQRVTIENRTIGARWSADIKRGTTGVIRGVIARLDDELFLVRNDATYGVVSLFGYGVGVFDFNAVESNDEAVNQAGYQEIQERVILTPAKGDPNPNMIYPTVTPCDPALTAPAGAPCEIRDLTFSPDALIFPSTTNSNIEIYALDQRRGMLDIDIAPPTALSKPTATPAFGLSLSNAFGSRNLYHPRLRQLHNQFLANGGVRPSARFTSVSPYLRTDSNANPENFALIAANNFGLLVVKIDTAAPLTWSSLVDVIWVPAGALAVRVIPRTDLALVVDNAGRVLLVDLRQIDESSRVPALGPCTSDTCEEELFPTAKKSIVSPTPALPPGADWIEVGVDDPRIIWKSDPKTVSGNIPPLIDPDTGILLTGDINGNDVKAIAAIDPRIQFRIRTDQGPRYVNSIVPLGIEPPPGIVDVDPNASLAAFWLEMSLPGSIADSLGNVYFDVASESARPVAPDLPKSQLTRVPVSRLLPNLPKLRYQRGWNRFRSEPVAALADPRAAKAYNWAASRGAKEALGCFACDRPADLQNDPLVHELWSSGTSIVATPSASAFVGAYGYLAQQNRLEGRVRTLPADLVRPNDGATAVDKVAAYDLPTAGTMSEQVVVVNTGEMVQSQTDLAIKGRGLDFIFKRFYSSAITHMGPLGRNFDSPLFARIRRLPGGDVEYYDGTGRKEVFSGGAVPPDGVFLQMSSTGSQIVVSHADNTRLHFNAMTGRLEMITDRNMTRPDGSDGNTTRFLYNDRGQLVTVLDATGRAIKLSYYAATGGGAYDGCLASVFDFDGRTVKYRYDDYGRLIEVSGPDPQSSLSATPSTTYEWTPPSTAGTKEGLYTTGKLRSERDGLSRVVWSAQYQPARPWAVESLTSGGGTWNFRLGDVATFVTDPLGHVWEYGRDAERRIISLKEPGGATTSYGFDAAGRLASVTRPLGDKVAYGYGSALPNGDRRPMLNVTTITEHPRTGSPEERSGKTRVAQIVYGPANLTTSIITPDGATTTIVRDARGNPRTVTDATGLTTTTDYDEHGLLKASNDPRTGATTYAYDAHGYARQVSTSAGITMITADPRGNVIGVIDASGRSVRYGYNKLDQLETETRAAAQSRMTYDAAGNVSSRQSLVGTDPTGAPIYSNSAMTIDEVGRVRVQLDDGRTLTTTYDAAGNVTRLDSPGTSPVIYGYDNRNRIDALTIGGETSRHFYDDDGIPTAVRDARGNSTTFLTGGFGHSAGQANAAGLSTVRLVDAANRPVDERVINTTATGDQFVFRWTTREYDLAGRLVRETRKLFTTPLPLPKDGSDPSGATDVVTRWIYDDPARKTTVIDPNGNRSVSEFDDLGRLTKTTDSMGNSVEQTYNPNGTLASETRTEGAQVYRTRFAYDPENRLIALVDLSNQERPLTTTIAYDLRGNRTSVIDPDGNETRFEYDIRGRLIRTIDPEGGETVREYDDADRLVLLRDANGNHTKYTYDAAGNLASEARADGSAWSYTHDQNHNLSTVTDPNGTVTTLIYDSLDQAIERRVVKAANVGGPSGITASRDDLGRVVGTETDQSVKETFTYDSLDRLLTESIELPLSPRRTVTRSFDALSNVVRTTYPSGLVLHKSYDPLSRLIAIDDARGRIVSYADSGLRMTRKTLSNGLAQTWSYDPNGRLGQILATIETATRPIAEISYQRTPAGLKSATVRPDLAKRWEYTLNRNGSITSESILKTDTQPNAFLGETRYDIDRNLNYRSITRTRVDVAAVSSTTVETLINARNQYTAFGSERPSYDADGNLRRFGSVAVEYDAENRATRAGPVENTYSGSGRKVREKNGSKVRDYVLDGDRVIEEYENGQLSGRYVHGRDIDEIVRAEITAQTVIPLQDELGNVERLTDTTSATLERYEYDGYGRFTVFGNSDIAWRWLFQGREYNAPTNTYDFRARTLWTEFGRFGQEDPAGTDPNPYQAFSGNWAGNTDPSGNVVVMMHGIRDNGAEWASVVAQALGEEWDRSGADPGQDVVNLVNRQSTWLSVPCGCEPGEFGLHNAARALVIDYLDEDTRGAGSNVALRMNQLRTVLDASHTRIGEPLQVLAHSHGTAMLLAAARLSTRSSTSSMTWFHLKNAVLVGSDLERYIDISALLTTAESVHNFYSSHDEAVGIHRLGMSMTAFGGAGGVGFHDPSEIVTRTTKFRVAPGLTQTELPGIRHTGDPLARQYGSIPWMSRQLSMRSYASIFAITEPRRSGESQPWIDTYRKLRKSMGVAWTIDPSPYFYLTYPLRKR